MYRCPECRNKITYVWVAIKGSAKYSEALGLEIDGENIEEDLDQRVLCPVCGYEGWYEGCKEKQFVVVEE